MNAFDVDYWISVMYKYSWTPRTLDEKSQHALMYLFHLTDQIAPVGRDNRREFWITAKRGSIEDFRPYYDEEATEQELAEAMQEQYPEEEYWYKFVSVHHTDCRKGEFFGVFLNGKPVLSMNDHMACSPGKITGISTRKIVRVIAAHLKSGRLKTFFNVRMSFQQIGFQKTVCST